MGEKFKSAQASRLLHFSGLKWLAQILLHLNTHVCACMLASLSLSAFVCASSMFGTILNQE